MNLLPKTQEEFSQKEYWDNFFKKRGNKAFEWYGEYPELCPQLHKYIKAVDKILIVGCGNSTIGRDLYDVGCKNITSIDISQVAVRQMLQANQKQRPDLKFLQMDATEMTFEAESFSVALDKGTLDALMPDDGKAETVERINKYFAEIHRVLSTGGRYLCISLLQEHILRKILSYFPANNWMLRIVRCFEPEKKALEAGESSMPVFLIVATKFKTLPMQILEVNMGTEDKMQRLKSTEEVFSLVKQVQEAALVCSGLQRSFLEDQNEISIELFKPGENIARYTVYVVDKPQNGSYGQYAAFIVPQGREAEWLFSTKEGRNSLANLTKHNRLAIVSLHRKQTYESLQSIQDEIQDIIKNLAPASKKDKILFLSIGDDVGNRKILHEGHSDLSGDYIIEEVEINNEKFRRLYYLSSQNVIQSEAKVKQVKTKKGKAKIAVDPLYLTCNHHKYMSIGAHISIKHSVAKKQKIAVIGLGGGGLCTFLRKFLPDAFITAVDIDKEMLEVAKNWFDLQTDPQLQVTIQDGIEFLHNQENNEKFNSILFDVDSKDLSIGMSCPPKQFLDEQTLKWVKASLDETSGIFVINVVLRDEKLRPAIVQSLNANFGVVLSYKLKEDLNEIFICSANNKERKEELSAAFAESSRALNAFFKRKKIDDNVDLEDSLKDLKINC